MPSYDSQAMRSIARVEKEFGNRVEKENRGILWQRNTRESMPIKIRVVYKESSSFVPNIMNHLSKTFLFYFIYFL